MLTGTPVGTPVGGIGVATVGVAMGGDLAGVGVRRCSALSCRVMILAVGGDVLRCCPATSAAVGGDEPFCPGEPRAPGPC